MTLYKNWKWVVILVSLSVVLMMLRSAQAGGWAIVSVSSLPEAVIAERPFTIRFAVLQHGVAPVTFSDTTVTAVHVESGEKIAFEPMATKDDHFEVEMVLPLAGKWEWQINTFGWQHIMPALTVVAVTVAEMQVQDGRLISWPMAITVIGLLVTGMASLAWWQKRDKLRLGFVLLAMTITLVGTLWWHSGTGVVIATAAETAVATVPTIAPADMGAALFAAKGCTGCHQHDEVPRTPMDLGNVPNLTAYEGNPDYVRAWLQDPAAIEPKTWMPNLHLSESEIEMLVAFLSRNE